MRELVASKVYYHLGSYEDSLNYALGAGHLFDVSCTRAVAPGTVPTRQQTNNKLYVETTIAKCIDSYTEKRIKVYLSPQHQT